MGKSKRQSFSKRLRERKLREKRELKALRKAERRARQEAGLPEDEEDSPVGEDEVEMLSFVPPGSPDDTTKDDEEGGER